MARARHAGGRTANAGLCARHAPGGSAVGGPAAPAYVFVVKGAVIFPAAAALAWAVLAYICIDFGFWQKIVPTTPQGEQVYRSAAEAVLAAGDRLADAGKRWFLEEGKDQTTEAWKAG